MDDIVYHSKAVARGLHRPFLVADLPFASYPTADIALANSVRLMQDGGAEMVKLESGIGQLEIVEFLARHDIAVCAHLGLKPQSVHKTGGFRVQGRDDAAARRMLENARALESAGADIVLLECIPSELGKRITEALEVPVIGIGAGPDTDGQILVLYDVLDITSGRKPRFVKNFMDGATSNLDALQSIRARGEGQELSRARARIPCLSPAEGTSRTQMLTATTVAEVRAHVSRWREARERVVFVPTMGNLHAGHVSLSKRRALTASVSSPASSSTRCSSGRTKTSRITRARPRRTRRCSRPRGCDLMFSPEVGEIYPNGAANATRIEVPGISRILCGEFRPGHFEGVATVVAKLFHIVDPDVAIFGEKDFQQLTVIRRMVADLCLRVEIVGAPTVREDGRPRHELAQPVPLRRSNAGSRRLSTASCGRRWRRSSPACATTRASKAPAAPRWTRRDSAPTTSACATRARSARRSPTRASSWC